MNKINDEVEITFIVTHQFFHETNKTPKRLHFIVHDN